MKRLIEDLLLAISAIALTIYSFFSFFIEREQYYLLGFGNALSRIVTLSYLFILVLLIYLFVKMVIEDINSLKETKKGKMYWQKLYKRL